MALVVKQKAPEVFAGLPVAQQERLITALDNVLTLVHAALDAEVHTIDVTDLIDALEAA